MENFIKNITNRICEKPLFIKPTIMRRFRIVVPLRYMPIPEDAYIEKIIFENNDKFKVYRDLLTHQLIIECENKPKDLSLYGIFFVELIEN